MILPESQARAIKQYSDRGWPMVLCHGLTESNHCTCGKANCESRGKHPRATRWQESATADAGRLEKQLKRWPASNLGLLLGRASGLVDCEFDSREGEATAKWLALDHAVTPSWQSHRSTHRLFSLPTELAAMPTVSTVHGLEVRGLAAKAAQSIAPPSRHASGAVYHWLDGLGPEVDLQPLPEAVVELLAEQPRNGNGNGSAATEFVMEAELDLLTHPGESAGRRNTTLCRLLGSHIARLGITPDLPTLALAWNQRCVPPKPEAEVLKVVTWLIDQEQRKRTTARATAKPASSNLAIVSRPFAEIQPEAVRWLWEQRLALGKLSLLVGQPGLGKTFVAMDLAARISRGEAFPDGSSCPAGEVAILTGEDGAADTLRPRLDQAGADAARIHHIEGLRAPDGREAYLSLSEHLAAVDDWLSQHQAVSLLVIDPLTSFMGAIDSHNNTEVRSVLTPLAKLAETHRVAVLGVSHLSKRDTKAINRIIGSIAFVAAARAAWLVASDPDDSDEGRRLFLPVKNNLGLAPGLAFAVTDGRVAWEPSPVLVSADDIDAGRNEAAKRNAAEDWLLQELRSGERLASELYKAADKAGFSKRTLERAKRELEIRCYRQSVPGPWYWALQDEGESYAF